MRPSCPLARSPTLTWCWTTRHVRARPYIRACAPVLTSSLFVCAEKHRGFAFVQFEDRGDAADCIDNMNNAELFGRVLKVNVAKPSAAVGGHRPGAWLAPAPPLLLRLLLTSSALPSHEPCASLEPCVRVHRQSGSRKPTRTTRTRKRRSTAPTPRARRGPHEPVFSC